MRIGVWSLSNTIIAREKRTFKPLSSLFSAFNSLKDIAICQGLVSLNVNRISSVTHGFPVCAGRVPLVPARNKTAPKSQSNNNNNKQNQSISSTIYQNQKPSTTTNQHHDRNNNNNNNNNNKQPNKQTSKQTNKPQWTTNHNEQPTTNNQQPRATTKWWK